MNGLKRGGIQPALPAGFQNGGVIRGADFLDRPNQSEAPSWSEGGLRMPSFGSRHRLWAGIAKSSRQTSSTADRAGVIKSKFVMNLIEGEPTFDEVQGRAKPTGSKRFFGNVC